MTRYELLDRIERSAAVYWASVAPCNFSQHEFVSAVLKIHDMEVADELSRLKSRVAQLEVILLRLKTDVGEANLSLIDRTLGDA